MMIYEDYMQSMAWYRKKKKIYERANGKCERCGSNFRVEVHHLSYENIGNEKDGDLIVLCRKCHMIEHLWGIGKGGPKL